MRMSKLFLFVFISCSSVVLISGCLGLGPTMAVNMIPNTYDVEKTHNYSVKIIVKGGAKDKGKISNETFLEALEKAVKISKVFSGVNLNKKARFLLEVEIKSLVQPKSGFDMEMDLITQWKLTDLYYRKVWENLVVSNHIATRHDAFSAVKRHKIGTEAVAKKNIKEGIAFLSNQDIE